MVDCGDDDVAIGDEAVLIGRQGAEVVTADELGRPARHDRLRDHVRHQRPGAPPLRPWGRRRRPIASTRVPGPLELLAVDAASCTRCRLAEGRRRSCSAWATRMRAVDVHRRRPGRRGGPPGPPVRRAQRQAARPADAGRSSARTREHVYIANIVKCRPPENRDPKPDEIDACRPYLTQQLDLIRAGRRDHPRPLRRRSGCSQTTDGITRLRGRGLPLRPRRAHPHAAPGGGAAGRGGAARRRCGPTSCGPSWRWPQARSAQR